MPNTDIFREAIDSFDRNQNSVRELMNFDRIILDFCIDQVKLLEDKLRNSPNVQISNNSLLPVSTIQALANIRANDSMRDRYKDIFNQCVVLSVSHFTSSLHDIFKLAISYSFVNCPEILNLENEDIKLSLKILSKYKFDMSAGLGDMLMEAKNISFQDMQSIRRDAFGKFLGVEFVDDTNLHNIIFSQASRHCIVHHLGVVNDRMMNQIKGLNLRSLKKTVQQDEVLSFIPRDIDVILESMKAFIESLTTSIYQRLGG